MAGFGGTTGFGSTNNFGTGSFSSRFKNPYQFSSGRVDSDTSKALFEAIKRRNEEDEFALRQERSLLDRTFDTLMIGNYASANYASDWVKFAQGKGSFGQAFNGVDDVWQGFKAGNPFGDGSEEDEKTYSNVLGEMGWNPSSMIGKFAKGTVGFVGDVLLDPTTYLTGGVSAVLKGTGRVGQTAKTLDALKKTLPKSVVGRSKVTHMTPEMAEHIIARTGKVIEPEQLAYDSKTLAEKYNRLLGIRDVDGVGKPITFGVENLPFGDKIAPQMGVLGKTLTLSDGTAVRKMSDTLGIAGSYASIRNTIYGGRIGKLLSTTAPLKILADRNPAELYDFMKFIDTTKGQKLNKLESDKAIREKAKDLLGLTPAQNKELLTLLEDKTIWSKVKGTLKFAETNKGKDLAKAIAKGAEGQDALASEANELKSFFDELKKNESLTKAERDALEEMRNQIVPDDVKAVERIEANKARIKALKEKKEQLLKEDAETSFKASERKKTVTPKSELKTSPAPLKTSPTQSPNKVISEKSYKEPEPVNPYADTVAEGERLHKVVQDAKSERESFQGEREMGEIMRDRKISDRALRENGTKLKSKEVLRKSLSKYIYGGKGSLPSGFREDAMGQIVDMMRHADDGDKLLEILKSKESFFGKMMPKELSDAMDLINNDGLPEMIRDYIKNNPQLFSDHAKEVHIYLGEKHKYKKISDLREPIIELMKKKNLTKAEQSKLKVLQTRLALRDMDYDKFFNKMSHDEFKKMREVEDAQKNGDFMERMFEPDEVADKAEPLPYKVQFAYEEHKMMLSAIQDNLAKNKAKTKKPNKKLVEHYSNHEITMIEAMKAIFPTRLYSELNTTERNIWMRVSSAMAWERTLNPDAIPQALENAKRALALQAKKNKEVQRITTLAKDAQFGKVVSFKEGDEFVDGTIIRIEPNKVERSRTESDPNGQVKWYKEPYKNAKGETKYRRASVQPTREVKYFEEDGSNSYIVRLADGSEKKLSLDKIEHVSHAPAKTFDEIMERSDVIKEKVTESKELLAQVTGEKAKAKQIELDALKAEEVRMERVNAEQRAKRDHIKQTNQEKVAFEKARKERVAKIDALEAEIKKESKSLKGREARHTKKQNKLFDEFATRVGMQSERVMDLEGTTSQMGKALDDVASALSGKLGKDIDMNDIDGTIEHINVVKRNMEEALASDEALEQYVRLHMEDGHFIVRDALYDANVLSSTKIALTERASNEEMIQQVKWLRGEFNKIGADEVEIGKLSEGQFVAMMDFYVPHIPTEDGARYFDSTKELQEHRAGLTKDLGYGNKWNPYGNSRTIKGSNIPEINALFAEKLKGKNLFSDNMGEIYVNRMLKHNELMFDNQYMKTMMHDFGHAIPEDGTIRKGYKAVANHGEVRELVKKEAKKKLRDMVSGSGGKLSDNEMKVMFERALEATFKDLKIPREALDAKGLPMLELTSEQVRRLDSFGIARQVNDAIVTKANNARKLAIARDESSLLKMYDKFTHFIKLQQTTIMPSFHIRNEFSNDFTNYLAVGRDAFDIKLHANALKASLAGNDLEKLRALPPIVSKDGRVYHYDEILDLAKAHGALDEGFFAVDLGADTMTRGIGKKFIKPKLNPTDTGNFFGYRLGSKVGTVIESKARLVQFTSLLRNGSTPAQASESVQKYLFDYSDLTQFETQVMKRIFPYYTWMRKNARLQVSELIDQTEKYAMLPKFESGIEGMNNEEDLVSETYTSDFARDWIQTPFSTKTSETLADGTVKEKKEPWMLSPNLPYMDLARLPDVANPLDSIREYFSSTNPAMKLPTELAINKNTFFDSEIAKTDKEGVEKNPIKDRLLYVAKQMAPVGAVSSIVGADNATETGLALMNTFGGVKVSSYDYEMSKNMMLVDAIESGKGIKGEDTLYDKLVNGGKRVVEIGKGQRKVISYYSSVDKHPSRYKINEDDLIEFEKRKAITGKQIEAKYGQFKGDSKLQWSLMEGKQNFEVALVKDVIDGDTFNAVNEKGEEFTVRVLLLDTPETVDKRKNYKMPVGQEASDHAKKSLGGKQVLLFKDSFGDEQDTYERSLFYVHTTDGDYAKNMIKKGFGRTFFEQNQTRVDEYRDAQDQASDKKEGIWNFEGYPNVNENYFNSDVPSVKQWQERNK